MPPAPPRHAPRPFSPTATSTQRREVEGARPAHTSLKPRTEVEAVLDHLTAAANHDAKAKEGNKCKSRGSLHNTRAHIRTGGGIGQLRTPRTLRTGNLGERFPTALPSRRSIILPYGHLHAKEGGRSVPPRNPYSSDQPSPQPLSEMPPAPPRHAPRPPRQAPTVNKSGGARSLDRCGKPRCEGKGRT